MYGKLTEQKEHSSRNEIERYKLVELKLTSVFGKEPSHTLNICSQHRSGLDLASFTAGISVL